MKKQEKFLLTGFAIFSAITSFIFVFYAVNINFDADASQWLKTFAYVAGGYGLMNIYILSWAWRSQVSWAVSANMVIAACFLGVFTMDAFRDGINGGIEIAGVMGLACVLGINWFTVKKLCQREKS